MLIDRKGPLWLLATTDGGSWLASGLFYVIHGSPKVSTQVARESLRRPEVFSSRSEMLVLLWTCGRLSFLTVLPLKILRSLLTVLRRTEPRKTPAASGPPCGLVVRV